MKLLEVILSDKFSKETRQSCFLLLSIVVLNLCCCSLAPVHRRPALSVAATYPNSMLTDKTSNGKKAVDINWQEYFCDPYLQQLITQALDHNRDLRMAVLRVDRTKAMYHIEYSKLFPNINLAAAGERTLLPSSLGFSPTNQISHLYRVGFGTLAWELDFWGKIRNLKKSALENFLMTAEAQRATRLSLIMQVAHNYLGLCELSEQIGIAQKTIVSHQKSLQIFTKRFKAGITSRIDLLQVKALLTQAQALCVTLKQARDTQVNALTLLVGSPINSLPEKLRLNDTILFAKLGVGLPSELLTDRPEIIAAEHKLRASGANIGAARAAFFPSIKLTGAYGTASNELSGLFKSGSSFWSFIPDLTLPIFNAGRNIANLKVAKADQKIAIAEYEKAVQVAFREVADALAAHYWLKQQVEIQQCIVTTQRERTRLALLRYNNGAATYLEVLDAERDLLGARQKLVQVRQSLLSSRVNLYAALGGGN